MPKWTKHATYKNFYKYYSGKKKGSEKYVDKKQHKKILEDLFAEIEQLLYEGQVYDIPWGFGELRINKLKSKYKPRDFKQERIHLTETGEEKEIYHQNFHTDGYVMKIGWYRRGDAFRNRGFYRFHANRLLRERFATILKTTGDVSKYMHFDIGKSNHLKHVNVLV